jgi:hypothetical protein
VETHGTSTRRGTLIALVTVLFLAISLDSAPTTPSVPQPEPTPDLEEIAALEHIADWLLGDEDFHALRGEDLEERERTFELFREVTPPDARQSLLDEMPYGAEISEAAETHSVDSLLLAALVEVESRFSPGAVSPRGAVGLTQVLPSTARWLGSRNLHDPKANLQVGARYLSYLLDRFEGDLELALAAYNAGPGNVARYGGIPPFQETEQYVDKVLSIYTDHHREAWDASGATELLLFR